VGFVTILETLITTDKTAHTEASEVAQPRERILCFPSVTEYFTPWIPFSPFLWKKTAAMPATKSLTTPFMQEISTSFDTAQYTRVEAVFE